MKKYKLILLLLSLILVSIFLPSCTIKEKINSTNSVNETTSVSVTQSNTTVKQDSTKDDFNISASFTWEDFKSYAEKAGIPNINMCEYFSAYYYGKGEDAFLKSKGTFENWEYSVFENQKAFITGYNGNESTVTVPNEIDGYEVIGINCRFQKGDFLPNTKLKKVIIENGIFYIGDDVFENCKSLSEVELPDSLMCIDNGAFLGCKALGEINLPENLICIDDSAFMECESLEEITVPNSVNYLGSYAFCSCYKLKSVQLSENITKLYGFTFAKCSSLSSVNTPENLSSIFEANFQETNINLNQFSKNGVSVYS